MYRVSIQVTLLSKDQELIDHQAIKKLTKRLKAINSSLLVKTKHDIDTLSISRIVITLETISKRKINKPIMLKIAQAVPISAKVDQRQSHYIINKVTR